MSLDMRFRADLLDWLRADAALIGSLNGLYESPPVAATTPWLALEPILAADWSAGGMAGRELRIALTLADDGPEPDRLASLAPMVEARMSALPASGGGYRLIGLVFLRARTARDGRQRWLHQIEFRARIHAA